MSRYDVLGIETIQEVSRRYIVNPRTGPGDHSAPCRVTGAQHGSCRATETGTRYEGDPAFEGPGERYPGILGGHAG